MSRYRELKDKFLHGGGLISTFLRSSVSSQVASWIDLGTSMLLYSFVFVALDPFYRSNLSVAIGAIAGGIVNCCINYRFTFHAAGQSVKAVGVKYFLVWTGSLLLNMYGTTGLATLMSHWQWLLDLGWRHRWPCHGDGTSCCSAILSTARLRSTPMPSAWSIYSQKKHYRTNVIPILKTMAENEMTMTQKSSTFKRFRDSLQQGIYFIINPFVRFLIRIGVTPNMVTTIGLLGNIAAAAIFVYAGYSATPGTDMNYPLITWGGVVIILFSLFDMLDGQVARLGNMTSTFGAMYDSVLDRYCELFTLGGLSYYLIQTGYVIGALITFVALVGSIMVSYVRARAEGLGLECKVGFMQRPERVVVTTIGALATGITGQCVSPADFDAVNILIFCMAVIAVFANITAFARINHCRRLLCKK